MRLKTFTAKSMPEAMAEVRAALGPDAIIVSTRAEHGLVRITAAAEDPAPPPQLPEGEEIADIFARHGCIDALAESLVRAATAIEAEDPAMAIAAALDMEFHFAGLEDAPVRPLSVIGLPGAGKTAALAKIAARAVLAERSVALITTDSRAGAVEQLASYARLLKLSVTAAPDRDALASAVAQADIQGYDLTLIDTPGLNPYDQDEVRDLQTRLAVADGEVVAVHSAGGDGAEAADLGALLADLGCRRFIATRLDTVRRFGSLLTFARGGALAFAGVSASPYIGDMIESLNPVSLARLLAADAKTLSDAMPRQSRTVVTS